MVSNIVVLQKNKVGHDLSNHNLQNWGRHVVSGISWIKEYRTIYLRKEGLSGWQKSDLSVF